MSKELFIRPFTPDDYPGLCDVMNAVYPDYPETPAEVRRNDAQREAKLKWARFVAEDAGQGQVLGIGEYGQSSGMYHPRRFHTNVLVLPAHQGRGIGGALYDHVLGALAAFDPLSIRTQVRADQKRGLRFLAARDWTEAQREQESRLDLSGFDPDAFAAEVRRAHEQGIVIRTVGELKSADPDGFALKMHELHWVVGQDIPHVEPLTYVPHEEWIKRFENPNFLWDGNVVALDGDHYVGVSVLWDAQAGGDLYTGTTGVRREYRGRGIATALKVRALTWAKEHGAGGVRTWNEVNNTGMLNINFRLGFVKQPSWITLVKTLKDEAQA